MYRSRIGHVVLDYLIIIAVMLGAAVLVPFETVGFDPFSPLGRSVVAVLGLALVCGVYWRHYGRTRG